jgi:hypothetical protein
MGSGPYTTTPRGPTSRSELVIPWTYPTFVEKSVDDGRTRAIVRRALAPAEAFAFLAGEDRRPLLVLRECLKCNGTDDALMNRNEDNERTLLLSRWFHCIKLPPDVLAADHPFHALFADEKPGHLFFARPDGSGRRDLTGQQSRTELWALMEEFLDEAYGPANGRSLDALLDLLDRFDRLDASLDALEGRLDDLIEKGQGDSAKAKKLVAERTELQRELAKARAEAVRLSELELRAQRPKKAAAAEPAGG